MKTPDRRGRHGMAAVLSAVVLVLGLGGSAAVLGASAAGASTPTPVQHPGPSGTSGTTINPLQYNCGNDAATCGQVGESYGYYNGKNVSLLYTQNYYCAPTVASHDTATGCEAGKPAPANPTGTSKDGTSLGNTTHAQTLYVAVPLFSNPPPTQCTSTATCIDHPPTIDLSALAPALTKPATTPALDSVPIPAHNHIVATRATGHPVWWNVKVVATKTASVFSTLTSVSAIQAALAGGKAVTAPTNAFLFFQVLPGTVPATQASNLTATQPPGNALPSAPTPSPTATQKEPGRTITNLTNQCDATAPNCQTVGTSRDWIDGQNVQALYTQQYFCDKTVSAKSSSGCEAGAAPNQVPPGVATTTAPSPGNNTNKNIDPLYIPLPIYSTSPVSYLQCSAAITCIDHPATIDLSRLASALGVSNATSLNNVPLPGHDHLLTTRNGDQPEWWNVIVVPVTSPAGLATVEKAKSYAAIKPLEGASGSGIGSEVATNAYLWFQTLPGSSATTPGPVQTSCTTHFTPGTVVGAAAVDDGTGYYEVNAAGDVAAFGAATCYGSLSGQHLNAPIVGMAVDRATGGYWLVASDGGVFAFNAPFQGSAGGIHLNKPIVGMTATLNGNGYWLVASDGGIFSYNVPFQGSTGGIHLNKPIVGMGLDRSTGGYWLVASDGGVFSFNAPFYGSTGAIHLNKPIVGMAPTSDGSGYRLIASDGGVFSFNAPFYGSHGGSHLNRPIVAGMNNNSYDGYWMVASDGGVFTYSPTGESMPFYGSGA